MNQLKVQGSASRHKPHLVRGYDIHLSLIHICYRMTKAAELLKLTELSINDISNAVGYPNQLHFSRAFKKTYGIPPRQWRQENKMAPAT